MEVRDVHGHRVGVVEQPRVGAHLCHVAGDVGQDREGPQAAEDSADADGVADGLVQPVARRNLEVPHRGLVHADRDDVDDVVRAVECAAAVAGGDHLRVGACRAGGGAGDRLGRLQPFVVDVVQHHPDRAQLGERQDVAEQFAGELDAARADDDDGGFHCTVRRSVVVGASATTASVRSSPRFSSL